MKALTVFLFLGAASIASAQSPAPNSPPTVFPPLPFVLDMGYHNPGEPRTASVFLDPKRLRSWGFNGNVPHLFVQAAVTFDSLDRDIFPAGSPERVWVEENARKTEAVIQAMKAEGLPCYPFTDFIVLPKKLVEKYQPDICDAQGRIDVSRPKTREILRVMLDEIFKRFPDLGGITLRHGETYLHDLPHHTGGNPILNGQASHVELINLVRAEVCVKRGKMLFYRTWDFGSRMHTNPKYYLGVTDRIEPHTNLVFSIKHQAGDFHRLLPFNPCLGIGRHRQIVEVQSQREYEGKGAFPNYNGQGVIEGWEEYASRPKPRGLRDLVNDGRCAGVWTWSRGGGWRGPYIPNEFWCELNTYVVARWAQNPARTEEDVFNEFAREVAGLREPADLARLRRIALLSAAATLRSQYGLVHALSLGWNRDQYFADLTGQLKSVRERGRTEAFLKEKAEATSQWKEIEKLSAELQVPDAKLAGFIRVSCTYGRVKCEIIEQMCRIILHGLEAGQADTPDARVAEALAKYDALWDEWRKLRADHPDSCATLYKDTAFSFAGGVPGEQPGMGEAVNKFRSRQ